MEKLLKCKLAKLGKAGKWPKQMAVPPEVQPSPRRTGALLDLASQHTGN